MYPGADVNSDPVVADFRFRRFSKIGKTKVSRNINIERLKNDNTKASLNNKFENDMNKFMLSNQVIFDPTWDELRNAICKVQESDVGCMENNRRKEWIISEILALVVEKRKENKDPQRYRELNRTIRKCREAKNGCRRSAKR